MEGFGHKCGAKVPEGSLMCRSCFELVTKSASRAACLPRAARGSGNGADRSVSIFASSASAKQREVEQSHYAGAYHCATNKAQSGDQEQREGEARSHGALEGNSGFFPHALSRPCGARIRQGRCGFRQCSGRGRGATRPGRGGGSAAR